MFLKSLAGLTLATMVAASAAQATIVNLSADPSSANAGHNSGPYAYNPVTLNLSAGTYTVSLSSIAQGGLYDAYSVAVPAGGNYTDINWSVSLDNTTAYYTQTSATPSRYATAALANAAYAPISGTTFTLTSAQNVEFYLDDTVSLYFLDDAGGVSLNVTKVAEPATMGLLIVGAAGTLAARRRNKAASVA